MRVEALKIQIIIFLCRSGIKRKEAWRAFRGYVPNSVPKTANKRRCIRPYLTPFRLDKGQCEPFWLAGGSNEGSNGTNG